MTLSRAAYVLAMRLLQSDLDLDAEEQEAVNLTLNPEEQDHEMDGL